MELEAGGDPARKASAYRVRGDGDQSGAEQRLPYNKTDEPDGQVDGDDPGGVWATWVTTGMGRNIGMSGAMLPITRAEPGSPHRARASTAPGWLAVKGMPDCRASTTRDADLDQPIPWWNGRVPEGVGVGTRTAVTARERPYPSIRHGL